MMWGDIDTWRGYGTDLDLPSEYLLENEQLALVLEMQIKSDEINQAVSDYLKLSNFLVVNQVVKVSITEWLGEDEWTKKHGIYRLVQEALTFEASKILDMRKRSQQEMDTKMKLKEMEAKGDLTMAHNLGGISGYLR